MVFGDKDAPLTALLLHGGPGSGANPSLSRWFNPKVWKLVTFDQRGSGKSRPSAGDLAALDHNTTWDCVADCEALRAHLGVDTWMVVGGSWGSTLALAVPAVLPWLAAARGTAMGMACVRPCGCQLVMRGHANKERAGVLREHVQYAEAHPSRVSALVMWGMFTVRPAEIAWLYASGGASCIFPDAWEEFVSIVRPEVVEADRRGDRTAVLSEYYEMLTRGDEATQLKAAIAMSKWEGACSMLLPSDRLLAAVSEPKFAVNRSRIEAHYFVHGGWLDPEDQLIRDVHRIRDIPCVMVQGRYDVVCPIKTAWDIHKAWPEAELVIVPDAGHAGAEPGNQLAIVNAIARFGEQLQRR